MQCNAKPSYWVREANHTHTTNSETETAKQYEGIKKKGKKQKTKRKEETRNKTNSATGNTKPPKTKKQNTLPRAGSPPTKTDETSFIVMIKNKKCRKERDQNKKQSNHIRSSRISLKYE